MLSDTSSIVQSLSHVSWRPVLSGSAALIIAVIAGWGIAGDSHLAPVRWIGVWVDRVIVPILRAGWLVRAFGIFANNSVVCALVIAAGTLPGGSWTAITLVGLSMGFAMRHLGHRTVEQPPDAPQPPPVDGFTAMGLLMNLLEVPALGLVMGLSIGQLASDPHFSAAFAWALYGQLIVPALLIAACGESIWIGRVQPFDAHKRA